MCSAWLSDCARPSWPALIVRNETSYDHFLPGFERLYLAGALLIPTGHPGLYTHDTPSWIAAPMQQRFPAIEAVTRVALQEVKLKHERVEAKRKKSTGRIPMYSSCCASPRSPAICNRPCERPDSIVITRSVARKYFGTDAPVGASLLVGDGHPMTVTAVIEDLPEQNSQFETAVFASGVSSYSELTRLENDPLNRPDSSRYPVTVRTYFRLAPGASLPALRQAMPEFFNSVRPARLMPAGTHFTLNLVRIDQIHLSPDLSHGVESRLMLVVIIGVLILVIAAVNFVNLTTARSARRALEVGCAQGRGGGPAAAGGPIPR